MTTNESVSKDKKTTSSNKTSQITETKSCFIIMPIADMHGYDIGHFNRVYRHIIEPACIKEGFTPVRADDVTSSNFIVLDILRRIVECEMAICDLSGRNPNVMYELGLRQAFNKKTVLIKDEKTVSPFDVQAFRYCEYDSALRIDNAFGNITSISKSLKSTYDANEYDINSIVQLLKIEPASVGEKTKLSTQDTILFKAIESLSQQMDTINKDISTIKNDGTINNRTVIRERNFSAQCENHPINLLIGKSYRVKGGERLGKFKGIGTTSDGKKAAYIFEHYEDSSTSVVPIDCDYLDEIIQSR